VVERKLRVISQRCNTLSLEIAKYVDDEVSEVERQLNALSDGLLARELRGRAKGSTADDAGVNFDTYCSSAGKIIAVVGPIWLDSSHHRGGCRGTYGTSRRY